VLDALGSSFPVVAAPMAGGPTTPALVLAAAEAGFGGFLAAGYKSPEAVSAEIEQVRRRTTAFGVNLFAPPVVPVDLEAYAAYRELLRPLADHYGVELPGAPVEDDDHWQAKVGLLTDLAPPLVSFTFGIPDPATVDALHRAGSRLVQTVTSAAEARLAAEAGVDGLVAQSADAGGHWGTLTPATPPAALPLPELVREVRASVDLPVLAAGGVGTAGDVREALASGAEAVVVGTVLLLADEAGTNAGHRAGLGDGRSGHVTTTAFSGRPAGALPNGFLAAYDGRGPLGYPALHHLTGPIRRAAAAAGDPEHVNLWAGTGHRHARAAPVAEILRGLLP